MVEYNLSNKPREFLILINKNQDDAEMINTIFHELVHCKQFAKKELNPECTRWKKQSINLYEYSHEELPWEQEAEDISNKLVEQYYDMARTRQI